MYLKICCSFKTKHTIMSTIQYQTILHLVETESKRCRNQRNTSTGLYPFNHVYESESGHVFEIDDTSGGERLLRQHSAGTYEEIIASGDKTVKVVGNNFECVVGGSNVLIQGDVNLTTYGTRRDFIEGDYILEVGGKYTRKIHGSEQVKIGAGEGGGNLKKLF